MKHRRVRSSEVYRRINALGDHVTIIRIEEWTRRGWRLFDIVRQGDRR